MIKSETGCLLGKTIGCLALNRIGALLRHPPTQIMSSWIDGLNLRNGLAYPMQFSLPQIEFRSDEGAVDSCSVLCRMASSLGNVSR